MKMDPLHRRMRLAFTGIGLCVLAGNSTHASPILQEALYDQVGLWLLGLGGPALIAR